MRNAVIIYVDSIENDYESVVDTDDVSLLSCKIKDLTSDMKIQLVRYIFADLPDSERKKAVESFGFFTLDQVKAEKGVKFTDKDIYYYQDGGYGGVRTLDPETNLYNYYLEQYVEKGCPGLFQYIDISGSQLEKDINKLKEDKRKKKAKSAESKKKAAITKAKKLLEREGIL